LKPWTKRTLLALAVALIGGGIALLAHAWPFLTYPVTELALTRPAPLASAPTPVAVAGVASRDITAPIGIPKFGYSTFARDADGFRTRLKARAFYLRAPGQTPMALVQADLGTGSLPLQRRVAELIAAHTDVPAHALSLLVTHTHSGPGNYLGSDFYNVFGSNRAGFEPKVFEFLAQQIAGAVIEAYQQRRPAKFASGQREVFQLTRNRSLAAWAENHGIPEHEQTDALALEAVNPRLTLLRIDLQSDAGCYYPAGALSLYSIHGTAIPAFTAPYHADIWSWASRGLESQVSAETCAADTAFVHGAAQATHADNTPNIDNALRGHREAQRIGTALADNALTLFNQLETQLSTELDTGVASRQLDLLDQTRGAEFGLCERAVVGAATAGAANGDEVFPISYLPFLAEDWPRSIATDGCHGVKQWMLSKLQVLLPAERFPHRALIQVMRINHLVIVPLPWEVTFESGNRIRDAVQRTLPDGAWQVEISSLANGYFGYAVTAEEYRRQFYEGGHTLYGPGTSTFLATQSAALSEALVTHGEIDDIPDVLSLSLLSQDYWPQGDAAPARALLDGPDYVAGDDQQSGYWRVRYRDTVPARLALHTPLLSMEVVDTGAQRATDAGTDLQILLLDEDKAGADYEARWHTDTPLTTPVRFRVDARGDQPVWHSPSFGP